MSYIKNLNNEYRLRDIGSDTSQDTDQFLFRHAVKPPVILSLTRGQGLDTMQVAYANSRSSLPQKENRILPIAP